MPATVGTAATPVGSAGISPALGAKLREAAPGEELSLIIRLKDFATDRDAVDLHKIGITLTRALTTVPAYGATGTSAAVMTLAKDPRVAYIELDLPIHPTMSVAARETRARDVWDALPGGAPVVVNGQVIDGTGVGVAVVDSGIDATHPDLEWKTHVKNNWFRVAATANFFVGIDGETEPVVPDAANFVDVPNSDMTSGHGTHVAGIVGGSGAASGGLHKGAAPGATIYGYGMGQGLSVLAADEAFDHILRNYDSFDPPVKVVTNSYGSCGDHWDPESLTSILVGKLLEKDVNVLWSAGNIDDTCTDIHGGGAADDPRPGVISVANYDGSGVVSRDATINPSSSQGWENEPASMWPDIAAPGTDIAAASATTGAISWISGGTPGGYAVLTGTSMSTPHVAGIVALIRQANPDLSAADVEQVLRRTAYKYDEDIDQEVGHIKKGVGLADAFAAVHAVTGGLGADSGVQALSIQAGKKKDSDPVPILRTGPETATGTVTVSGDVLFFPRPGPTYTSTVLFFHGTPAGGFNPTGGVLPYTFAAGETMTVQARAITPVAGAPAALGATATVTAKNLDTGAVLFTQTCTVFHFVDTVLAFEEDRCGVTFNVPPTVASGVYEVVFTLPVGDSSVEIGVENVMIFGAGAGGATLVDPGARAPTSPPLLPSGKVTVQVRFGSDPWTPATVFRGSEWRVKLAVPAQGGVLQIEATDGGQTAVDRLSFVAPPSPLSIDGPASALAGTTVTFTASVSAAGTWTVEWDGDYDGVTFDVDGTGATFAKSFATEGTYTVAARATDGVTTLLQTFTHVAEGPVQETILVDDSYEQLPAVPFALAGTFFASEGIFVPDPQATLYEIDVPAGVTQLVVEVSWGFYDTLGDNGVVTANDFDVWIEDPAGVYDHHGGATANHGEVAIIENPAAGHYFVDITPFLVLQPDTVHVVIKTLG